MKLFSIFIFLYSYEIFAHTTENGKNHFFHPGWVVFYSLLLISIIGIYLQIKRDTKKSSKK